MYTVRVGKKLRRKANGVLYGVGFAEAVIIFATVFFQVAALKSLDLNQVGSIEVPH